MTTCKETLESAGPAVLELIEAGRKIIKEEADSAEREAEYRDGVGRNIAYAHWKSLKGAVARIVPASLLPYCSTHQHDMPDGLVSWQTWGECAWQKCNSFDFTISVPGCVDVVGRLAYDSNADGWNQVRQFVDGKPIEMWLIRKHSTYRDDESGFVVYEERKYADSASRLDVALAMAADNYEVRNKLLLECEEKNEMARLDKAEPQAGGATTVRKPTLAQRLLDILHEVVQQTPLE